MEQAKLWALRTVLRKQCEDDDQFQWMADEVHVVGGGHPTRQSVREFFARVDEDAAGWYPGRATKKTGRPVEMTPLKRKSLLHWLFHVQQRLSTQYVVVCTAFSRQDVLFYRLISP